MNQKPTTGFTLVELMVAMLLFGVVLALVVQLTNSQGQLNRRVMGQSELNSDARLASVRMTELLSQAAYIYPSNQTLTLPGGGTVTTGKEVLAFLLASGTPYCSGPALTYCAVLYRVEARSGHTLILGPSNQAFDHVVTETQYQGYNWPASRSGTLPALNWSSLTTTPTGLVADSVDRTKTDLSAGMVLSSRTSTYDEYLLINVPANNVRALIQSVSPKLTLALKDGRTVERTFTVFAQPIPRQGPL